MSSEDFREEQLSTFYRSFGGANALPLDVGSPLYVPIHEEQPDRDPILALRQRILLAESQSVHLLTGFRGNGKSTQLLRLKKDLETRGCFVVLANMADYLLTTKPIELSDFLLSLMAAMARETQKESGIDAVSRTFWEEMRGFLGARVELGEVTVGAEGVGLAAEVGLVLKSDPDFKRELQQKLRGHVTSLVERAHRYAVSLVESLRRDDPDRKVVLLVDSVEHLRGVGDDAMDVQRSAVELFSGQAHHLCFPSLHVLYTVPPYVLPSAGNIGRCFGGVPVTSWPNIHVQQRDGQPDPSGLQVMENIVARRFASWLDYFSRPQLHRLATASGGDLRDFFRLVRECVISLMIARSARPDPDRVTPDRVTDEMIARVEGQLRSEMLPMAVDDALRLDRIAATKDAALDTIEELPTLMRFLDGNLIMNYVNGEAWYDVHPLLRQEIAKHVRRTAEQ